MANIPPYLTVAPASEEGRLYPLYEPEVDFISLNSGLWPLRTPFGVNIDATVILDAAPSRTVVSIEVLRPRRTWAVVRELPKLTGQTICGDLVLLESRCHLEYEVQSPAVAAVNESGTEAILLIEEGLNATLVTLSDKVTAYLYEGRFIGFHAKLA